MTTSFVPRPIYRVKPYTYLAEAGDTAELIAKKLGRPASDYRELVAANLEGRKLMPMPLGSPHGARTFMGLAEGEPLKIPAWWPEVSGALGDAMGPGGIMVPDSILSGIGSVVQAVNTASGGQVVPPSLLQGVSNAAVQWWTNTQGTTPAANPADYLPYVTTAVQWVNKFGPAIAAETSPDAVAAFPWAPFLALLPTTIDPSQMDWEKDIPGTNGTPWSSIPWTYLAKIGQTLETIKPPPVPWGQTGTTPEAVLLALKSVLDPALASVGVTVLACAPNSHQGSGSDTNCYCDPGYTWATATFNPLDPNSYKCVPVTAPTPTPTPTPTPGNGGIVPPPKTTPAPATPPGRAAPNGATTALTAADARRPYLIAGAIAGGTMLVAGAVLVASALRDKKPRQQNPKLIVTDASGQRRVVRLTKAEMAARKAKGLEARREGKRIMLVLQFPDGDERREYFATRPQAVKASDHFLIAKRAYIDDLTTGSRTLLWS